MTLLTDTLDSLWQVVAVGLLFGAGLPALFALGLRVLDSGSDEHGRTSPLAHVGAWLCFAVVLIAIAAGILMLTKDFLAGTFGLNFF
ncbi:hypothetical protein [Rhodococcus sp. HNM0569]|uniref:hypothetical protein n=1 Tax=Rhodococcus sp. HNM0569 TaxID=2716340 RepID=UPI00146B03BB|nr:hypothetical protein [Rhodococcus sp. HNM0569]NLU84152.1 hypothetical protein [Rhodococcus sp. HNM0569]